MNVWAINEANYMNFKDKRLNKRSEKLLEDLSNNSNGSIPEACETHAAITAAYRFFDNEKVSQKEIFDGFNQATKQRMLDFETIIYLSDSTHFVFSGRKSLKGVGVLKNYRAKGFIMHSTLTTANGIGLGLIHQNLWGRKPEDYGKRIERKQLPIEQRESFKWIEHMRKAQTSLKDNQKGIFICDRDADMLELFMEKRTSNFDLIIRSSHNRKLVKSKLKLKEYLNSIQVMGEKEITIPRSSKRKERNGILEIKYSKVTVTRDKNLNDVVKLNVVEAKEKIVSTDIENPVEWRLFTTIEINSVKDAIKIIEFYTQRWLIERFHYALKNGCEVEELQFEDPKRMFAAIAMYCIVAWRLMHICYSARNEPDKAANHFFSKEELISLYCYHHNTTKSPPSTPTIKEATLMLAKLGGFLGRKSDGFPGMKVVWRGLRKLEGFVAAYLLFGKMQRCV